MSEQEIKEISVTLISINPSDKRETAENGIITTKRHTVSN